MDTYSWERFWAIIFLQSGYSCKHSGSTPEEALERVEKESQLKLTYRPIDGTIFSDNPHVPCGIIFQKGIR